MGNFSNNDRPKFGRKGGIVAIAIALALIGTPLVGSAISLSNSPFFVKAQNGSDLSRSAIRPLLRADSATPAPAPTPTVTPSPTTPVADPLVTTMTINTALKLCNYGAFSLEVPSGGSQPSATIDWGDGSATSAVKTGVNGHSYTKDKKYKLEITGTLAGLIRTSSTSTYYGGSSAVNCIESVDHFGENSGMTDLSSMFKFSQNIVAVAAPPKTVTSLNSMFYSARLFAGDLSGWNVDNVTNFALMFYADYLFNSDLSRWNVSNAVLVNSMFEQATGFNGDVSTWRFSKVASTQRMFSQAYAFNGDVSKWTVGNVTNFTYMFWNTSVFNQPIGSWNIGKATDVSNMIGNTPVFDQNLRSWDITNVTKTDFSKGSKISAANLPKGAPGAI